MTVLYIIGVILTLIAPVAFVVWARKRFDLESSFYGLVAIGAGAAMVAYLGAMGISMGYFTIARLIFEMPAAVDRASVGARPDVLFFTTVVLGLAMEGVKAYGTTMFHTRMVRGNMPLFGAAAGIGAGMLQALWVLGAHGWSAMSAPDGALGAGAASSALFHVALLLLHVAVGALVMYRFAQGAKIGGVLLGGAIHGGALLLAALVGQLGGDLGAFLRGAPVLLGAGVAAVILRALVVKKGWPM